MTPHNDYAQGADHNTGWRPTNRWLRRFQSSRIKVNRRGVSLWTQLILLLCALVLVATASLGSIAYTSSRAIIEGGAVKEVGTTVNARKQVLLTVLTEQK